MTVNNSSEFDECIDIKTLTDLHHKDLKCARVGCEDIHEGDILVLKTTPHASDIPSVCTVRITESLDEWDREYIRGNDSSFLMTDIAFERLDESTYRFMLDNKYISGYHSGLGRRSDIAKGAIFYDYGYIIQSKLESEMGDH